MNSIRKPRSRPRVRSSSFRSFGWCLVREAAFAVMVADYPPTMHTTLRRILARSPGDRIQGAVRRILTTYPERRIIE